MIGPRIELSRGGIVLLSNIVSWGCIHYTYTVSLVGTALQQSQTELASIVVAHCKVLSTLQTLQCPFWPGMRC